MKPRSEVLTFRLAPPSEGNGVELVLSPDERKAVLHAAQGAPVGTWLRELVTQAVKRGSGRNVLEQAKDRATSAGMTLSAYLRLVVLLAVGAVEIDADVALARRWLRS